MRAVAEAVDLPEGAITLEGELVFKSRIGDPKQTPYKDSLYAVEYKVTKVVEGDYAEDAVLVYHWAFRDRKLLESSRYAIGSVRRLTLVPFVTKKELKGVNSSNDSENFELMGREFWAEKVEAMAGE